MLRKILTSLAAVAIFATSFSPVEADARDRRGYYDRGDHRGDYGRRHHYRDRHDDDGAAIAAGVVGLVLGLAIASAASQPRDERAQCRDNYQRCAPPPPRYDNRRDSSYYDDRGGDYDRDSAYAREYGLEGGPEGSYDDRAPCLRRERQWDRYANRYVVVDVPC